MNLEEKIEASARILGKHLCGVYETEWIVRVYKSIRYLTKTIKPTESRTPAEILVDMQLLYRNYDLEIDERIDPKFVETIHRLMDKMITGSNIRDSFSSDNT